MENVFHRRKISIFNQTIFSTLWSVIEISRGRGIQTGFINGGSIRKLLGSKLSVKHQEYSLSDYPIDILTFDNFFLATDISQRIVFEQSEQELSITSQWTTTLDMKTQKSFDMAVVLHMTSHKELFQILVSN